MVFQPGGTAVDNVYTSFALLYVDLASLKGPRAIQVDDTFGAIVIPAGAYNLDDVELAGKKPGVLATTVTIANGVTITGDGSATPFNV